MGKRAARGNGGVHWRRAWRFKGEDHIREILESCPRPIVHVCAGASRLGDVRVDAFVRADVTGLVEALPFKKGSVGTVLVDPPYHLPAHENWKIILGCLRPIRKGGVFLLHAPWQQVIAGAELVEEWTRWDGAGLHFPKAPVKLTMWRVLRPPRDFGSSRWRRRPGVAHAIKRGMQPGALLEAMSHA